MKKKIFIAMLIATMSFSIVACGSTTKEDTKATTESSKVDETKKSKESSTKSKNTEKSTESATEDTTKKEAYTYADMSATMFAQQTVNVRDLPDTSGNKIGSLKTNDEVVVTGQCNETGWYRISYNGAVAYVSNSYVASEKVAVSQPKNETAASQQSGNGGGSANASAGAPSAPSGKTLEECIAIAQSMGCDPYNGTWISDTEYVTYDVYSKSGYGMLPGSGPMDGRISLAEQVSSNVIYDDAEMHICQNTCVVTEWH